MAKKRQRLPALRPSEIIRMLLRNGFRELRQTKHLHFVDDAVPPHVVTVPFHRKQLKRGTLRSIIRQTGWTIEAFIARM